MADLVLEALRAKLEIARKSGNIQLVEEAAYNVGQHIGSTQTVPVTVREIDPTTEERARSENEEHNGLLALALGYNELAKLSVRVGDIAYWRLMRNHAVERLGYNPFSKRLT